MTILTKMGIKMKKEDGEALKQSVDQTRQLLTDMGVKPAEGGSSSTDPAAPARENVRDNVGNKI